MNPATRPGRRLVERCSASPCQPRGLEQRPRRATDRLHRGHRRRHPAERTLRRHRSGGPLRCSDGIGLSGRDRDDVGNDIGFLTSGHEPCRHDTTPLLDGRTHRRSVDRRADEARPDTATLAAGSMAPGALALEDRLSPVDIAPSRSARGRRRRLEDPRLSERERADHDCGTDEDRLPSAPLQMPNLTVVKYQTLDVTHRSPSSDARVSPAVGSAHPGSDRSRTINTFAAKTP